ncbi:MAG TPA: aminotransferase class IV [Thermoleophilaceae bacterium]|jgi:branched-chain amino acid aminotransferase|nr:aminotransferase class IV [Thermoleophilaceae bacterium]
MTELACLDGRIAPAEETYVPATDEGLLRGDGVFEVVRVYDGVPFALDAHLARMEHSAANLRLDLPATELLHDEALALLAERDASFDGLLRFVVTRGGRRLLLTEPLPAQSTAESITLGVVTFSPTRVLDGIKSLSYGGNMLASRLARERGFDEALLVTPHGRVLEAPTSSIFWVDERGAVCTPPLDEHILASITRDRVLKLLDVDERPATLDDVQGAGEAFLASTTREVQGVSAVEDAELAAPGQVTRDAAQALRQLIEEELQAVRA